MKWLNICFDFLNEDQYDYLFEVLDEFTGSTPSFQAQNDTLSIVRKITKNHLLLLQNRFVEFVAEISLSNQVLPVLLEKLKIIHDNTLDNKLKKMSGKKLLFHELYKKSNLTDAEHKKRNDLYDEINRYVIRNLRKGNTE
jgi:hypothetical protein